MITRRQTWSLVLVGMLVVTAGGCASSTESTTAAPPTDLASLAGTWQGTASGAQGTSQPITLRINNDGTYTATGGVYTAQGTAQVKDGKLVLTSVGTTGGSSSGGQSTNRVTTAVLSERRGPSQVVQVLTGSGAGSAGPFSYEVSRPKP